MYGLDIAEQACKKALSDATVRSEVVLNLMARELDPPPIDPVNTPDSLKLTEEPLANCSRYDALREERYHATP